MIRSVLLFYAAVGLKLSIDASTNLLVNIRIHCVPLATEPGISLIILTPMKILQRNLKRCRFVV